MRTDPLAQSRAEVAAQAAALGFRPQRNAGQNFLVDPAVPRRLVESADVHPGETVLEIGPGLGAVTDELRRVGAAVVAVELDRRLTAFLRARYADDPRLRIIEGDVRTVRLDQLVPDGGYKLVASLPFNVTSLVLRNFLEQRPRPTSLTLIIQREVAERVIARPGKMSLLAVAVQYLGRPELMAVVPKTSFWPEPAVEAAILRVEVQPERDPGLRQRLFQVARMGFAGRRKMLRNAMAAGLHLTPEIASQRLVAAGIEPTLRAQDVTLEKWLQLVEVVG